MSVCVCVSECVCECMCVCECEGGYVYVCGRAGMCVHKITGI